ncbi:hypothetical protein Lepto7376_0849 [[Leptolyngbya] sp. PCC 7376]|uniref:hypothetical protein n=1 Tax=[Leptolyngbya] sp. PCC 7376 TaxID=111781 RepID=UPI00029F44C3|nr:hypothetical protein [[Leptolyngbya] sp. PCC 7376]AFY37244.1 hypothetical protein Lepto7376_0849 [[Leptolyngbya] sp. PCC 7376]
MNFALDPHLDILAEQSLARLRRPTDLPLPDENFIDTTPVHLEGDLENWKNFFESSAFPLPQTIPELQNKTVVFDLDETLLMNSYISPEIWNLGGGYQDRNIYPAFRYDRLQPTLKGRLQKLLGRTDYDTRDRVKYSFLQQPRHIVCFRPGILYGLCWLKKQGVTLILATASARKRVQYLTQKFPILTELFEERIITANEIAYYYHTNSEPSESEQRIFSKRPYSLAAKVPAIFNFFLKRNDYDLLIDDSKTTKQLFSDSVLSPKLLAIDSDQALSSYGLNIILMTAYDLLKKQQPVLDDVSIDPQKIDRAEDPYYWSLCHTKDQILLK